MFTHIYKNKIYISFGKYDTQKAKGEIYVQILDPGKRVVIKIAFASK